ncbi:MAG TPA: cysteine hydrolase [Candidatus Dormibacteraeota bacterium]
MVVQLEARPQPLSLAPERTAVLVVDMQNAFASPGGMLHVSGVDVSPARVAVINAHRVCQAARAVGVPVIYVVMGYSPDLADAGGRESPNPQKELSLLLLRDRPELPGPLLVAGSWDFAIVAEMTPQPGELVIVKTRYSGFVGTDLDVELRTRGVRTLLVVGITTNVCVESTIRDAYFHEYWPVLVDDATMAAGPPGIHEATRFNVETFFGWVATTEAVVSALQHCPPRHGASDTAAAGGQDSAMIVGTC